MKIVAIAGSLAETSATRDALGIALEGAARHCTEVELLDLRDFDLPMCGTPGAGEHEATLRLKAAVASADGIILGTPEYHGGYSGVLKNALDLMGGDEFKGKLVGLIGVAGGALGGTGPLLSLRNVVRTVHAWVVPTQCTIPFARKKFEEGIDDGTRRRLMEVGEQVAKFAALHRSDASQEFLAAWESAYENPGA